MTRKINFGRIGKIVGSIVDTDEIDIYRDVLVLDPETGIWSPTGLDYPYASNIPCHISPNSTDNPDPQSIDVQPIIKSLTINCDISVDLKNSDIIVARRLAHDGTVLETYKSVIGEPDTTQSRKSAIMGMHTLK